MNITKNNDLEFKMQRHKIKSVSSDKDSKQLDFNEIHEHESMDEMKSSLKSRSNNDINIDDFIPNEDSQMDNIHLTSKEKSKKRFEKSAFENLINKS